MSSSIITILFFIFLYSIILNYYLLKDKSKKDKEIKKLQEIIVDKNLNEEQYRKEIEQLYIDLKKESWFNYQNNKIVKSMRGLRKKFNIK